MIDIKDTDIMKCKCEKCGVEFDVNYQKYRMRNRYNRKHFCPSCQKEYIKQMRSNTWNNFSNEKKEAIKNKHKQHWNSLSEEEKKRWSDRTKDQLLKRSKEEWDIINKKNSEGVKKFWKNADESVRNKMLNPMHQGFRKWYNNLTDEEKSKFYTRELTPERMKELSDRMKSYNEALSDEEKRQRVMYMNECNKRKSDEERMNIYIKSHKWYHELSDEEKLKYAESKKEWWNNLPDDEKEKHSSRIKQWWDNLPTESKESYINKHREWWDKLPASDKELYSSNKKEWYNNLPDTEKGRWMLLGQNLSNHQKEWYKNLPKYSKESLIRKMLMAGSGHNKLHQLFEKTFMESNELKYFYYMPEYPTTNNGVTHCWDYGIFDENTNIIAVVDLDGEYYHADSCDYDGMHSKLEYDFKRGLSIPNNIHHFIIYENNFRNSFKELAELIQLPYDKYIQHRFDELRSQPFPYPSYTDMDLIKSFNKLQRMNTNDKYHKSMSLNTRIGDRIIYNFHHSIYDSIYNKWNDDKRLMDYIKSGIIYHTNLNRNKLLIGFNMVPFSAAKAKMIINKYLAEYDEIFNPFNEYSGIMLGSIACGKRYTGYDISVSRINEANNIINFLKKYKINFNANVGMYNPTVTFQCLFTCIRNSNDELITDCISIFKCEKYVFVLDRTDKYKDKIVEKIKNGRIEYVVVINK